MRHFIRTTMTLGLLLVCPGIRQDCQASKPKPRLPFEVVVSPSPHPNGPGQIVLSVTVDPFAGCEKVDLRIDTLDNLEHLGTRRIDGVTPGSDSSIFLLDLQIPANDTSGIKFTIHCENGAKMNYAGYWVVLPDTVEFHDSNPRQYTHVLLSGKKPRIIWPDDSLRKEQEKRRQESIKVDYYDGQGNLVPEGKYKISPEKLEKLRELGKRRSEPSRIDPTKIYVSDKEGNIRLVDRQWWYDSLENVKRQRPYEEMRKLEETPLTDLDVQNRVIDGKFYQRIRGEYKFREMTPTRDPVGTARRQMDSLRAITDTSHITVILDLREPDRYKIADELIDSLAPMDSAGYYKTTVTGAVLQKLGMNDIRYGIYPKYPRERSTRRGTRQNTPDKSPNQSPPRKASPGKLGSVILFQDDFEFGFVGWTTGDKNDTNGIDTWGLDFERPNFGFGSAWCAADGDIEVSYDNYMDAWMHNTFPTIVDDHINVMLEYWAWYDTEPSTDLFSQWFSHDGLFWVRNGLYRHGYSGGWIKFTQNIPDTATNYYLMFVFGSNSTNNSFEGAYVDDIVISGDVPPLPDLTWDTPLGWDGPIIISELTSFGGIGNPLYSGIPNYINWGVANLGGGPSGLTFTDLIIDDTTIVSLFFDSLSPGETDDSFRNFEWTFTPGWHTVAIAIDSVGSVEEDDETNNFYQESFFFVEPQPNLTFFQPFGWDGQLVVSNSPSSRLNNTLYANQPAYVSWGVTNDDVATAGSYSTRLYVDGQLEGTFPTDSLGPGQFDLKEAIPISNQAVGFHTVRVEVDWNNAVSDESDETDNNDQITREWLDATLYVDGQVEFISLGPSQFPTYHDARYFLVELWDHDLGTNTPRVMLDSTRTDNSGYFAFSPIVNIDNDGTGLDIFVRVYANNDTAIVKNNEFVPRAYSFDSDIVNNVGSGIYSWSFPNSPPVEADSVQSGYFYVADVIRENYRQWRIWRPDPASDVGSSIAVLANNVNTSYWDSVDLIYISSLNSAPSFYPDTYDNDVISHEFGHRIQSRL